MPALTLKAQGKFPDQTQVLPDDFDSIWFVNQHGRVVFEVKAGDDGRSLIVRATDYNLVEGELYTTQLLIAPMCSNEVRVSTVKD